MVNCHDPDLLLLISPFLQAPKSDNSYYKTVPSCSCRHRRRKSTYKIARIAQSAKCRYHRSTLVHLSFSSLSLRKLRARLLPPCWSRFGGWDRWRWPVTLDHANLAGCKSLIVRLLIGRPFACFLRSNFDRWLETWINVQCRCLPFFVLLHDGWLFRWSLYVCLAMMRGKDILLNWTVGETPKLTEV